MCLKANQERWNPLSKSVPGKFHGPDRHSNCLQDLAILPANFLLRAWQNDLIWNTVVTPNSMSTLSKCWSNRSHRNKCPCNLSSFHSMYAFAYYYNITVWYYKNFFASPITDNSPVFCQPITQTSMWNNKMTFPFISKAKYCPLACEASRDWSYDPVCQRLVFSGCNCVLMTPPPPHSSKCVMLLHTIHR